MPGRGVVFVALLAGVGACSGGPISPAPSSIAITNVSVVPMDAERVVPDQTVLVRDGTIAWIGPTGEARLDPDALVVDGAGGFLMPGLADMHVHTWREVDQLLYVAFGVTTVRNMWGTSTQLDFRNRIAAGDLLGPTIYTAGPLMDGEPAFWDGSLVVTTPASARQAVRDQRAQGFDFVKVYNRLLPDVYAAIIDEAAEQGVPVAGHVPIAVGLGEVIAGPQVSVEHLNRYSTVLQSDPPDSADWRRGESGWLTADQALMPNLAQQLASDGLWSVPTLVLWERVGMTAGERQDFLGRPDVRFVHPGLRQQWQEFASTSEGADLVRRGQQARMSMVRALRDAGAPLLLGTDVGNPFLIPGASVLGELDALVKAGLTPFEALEAGTTAAAAFLGRVGEFGAVAVGARADLLLLSANPLIDVTNVGQRVGVMARGRWYPEADLRARLEEQVARFD